MSVGTDGGSQGGSGAYVPKHGRGGGSGRGRHRRAARRVLIGMNVLIALAIVASGGGVGYAVWRLNQIKRVHVSAEIPVNKDPQSRVATSPGRPAPAQPPETFLIVGSDTRAGLDQPGDKAYGSAGSVGGARSDTIMLARVVPSTKQVALLSIPRDTYLDIPTLGMQKINAALGVNPNLLIRVIESKFDIDVNHYIDVDFDSFKDIADALNGVQVYFPTEVRDVDAGLYIGGPGCVNLTGDLALAFVRSRKYTYYEPGRGWIQEAQSDLARIQRQQIFIRKLAAKAQSEGLGNPITLDGVIAGLTKNLTVDDSLSNGALVKLATTFRDVNPANIVGWTLPTYGETLQTSSGPEDILVPETAPDKAMVAQFLAFGEPVTPPPGASSSSTTAPRASGTTGTATTRPRATTTTASTVPPSTISVTVVNGSDITGQAGKTATALRSVGFDVVGTETAKTFGHTASVVGYGSGGLAAAHTVAAYLQGPVTFEKTAGLGATSVEITTGTQLAGVSATPAGGSGSGPTSPSTTSTTVAPTTVPPTTVPPTTSTTYVLPGTPSRGAPSCPS